MIRIIKTAFFTVILSIFIFILIIITKDIFFKPIIHWIMVIRGTDYYEGEDRGIETFSIALKVLFPIIFFISLAIVHKLMGKNNKP